MTKIFSTPEEKKQPRIESENVAEFFSMRAQKIQAVGPIRAVIYQDKDPELAERRDFAEKSSILPKLKLTGAQRVLDIGCGSGRWAKELIPRCSHYHGIDFSEDFVSYARGRFADQNHCRFTVSSVAHFSLSSIDEPAPFDRIICIGVLMYLNDDAMLQALKNIAQAVAPRGLIFIREPMGVDQRLTIQHHYSEEMNQMYSAIYRTQQEFKEAIQAVMRPFGIEITGTGNMYEDQKLNNRTETRQKWITLERAAQIAPQETPKS